MVRDPPPPMTLETLKSLTRVLSRNSMLVERNKMFRPSIHSPTVVACSGDFSPVPFTPFPFPFPFPTTAEFLSAVRRRW